MSKLKKRRNVPRIVLRLRTNGFTLEEARDHKIVRDNGIDIEYHWETLALRAEAEAENDKQPL